MCEVLFSMFKRPLLYKVENCETFINIHSTYYLFAQQVGCMRLAFKIKNSTNIVALKTTLLHKLSEFEK
jgi:hypothetical protein